MNRIPQHQAAAREQQQADQKRDEAVGGAGPLLDVSGAAGAHDGRHEISLGRAPHGRRSIEMISLRYQPARPLIG
jgi:hypothetical protein